MATAEFVFNDKIYISTRLSQFKINYGREPRMGFDIKKKEKHIKFVKEIKVKVALINCRRK